MVMQWLLAKVPGYQALPEPDREEIFNFTVLWTLFEAQVMQNFARADTICIKADEWRNASTLHAEEFDTELAYFQQRYVTGGAFTHHFQYLQLRSTAQLTSFDRFSMAPTTIHMIGC